MNAKQDTRGADCIDATALDMLRTLPESDPRRLHVQGCARCRALVESYALFLSPPDLDAAHADAADRTFDALRVRLLDGAPTPAPTARRGTWRDWFAPALRPAWALAVLTLVAGGALVASRMQTPTASAVLRGANDGALALGAASPQADGGVTLRWKTLPAADAYDVAFYSLALAELGRVSAGRQTTFRVPAASLPAAYAKGDAVLYRVIASHGGDEIARSPVGTLRRH